MKVKRMLYLVLMFLPLAATLVALWYLPDTIPAHYGADGQVNRWGSKYEMLILPLMIPLFGLFMLAMAKVAKKQEKTGENNEKVCLMGGLVFLVVFNAMAFYFLYAGMQQTERLDSLPVDLSQLLFGLLGIGLIVMGNVMPKARKNSVLGLRTSWSMKDETAWKKSQRAGGICLMAAGLGMLLCSILTKGWLCFGLSMGLLLAATAAGAIYSYWVASK